MNSVKLTIVVAAIAISIVSCSQTTPKPNTADSTNKAAAPAPATEPPANDIASGKELYAVNCQICHRDTGKGGKVTVEGKKLQPEDLTSDKMKKRDDAKLFEDISGGVADEGMPAFKDKLSPDEIKQVIKYIRTLQGTPPQPVTSHVYKPGSDI